MSENKKKEEPSLRVVKPKTKKFGLSVPIVRYPHDDFLPKPGEPTLPESGIPYPTLPEPTVADRSIPESTVLKTTTSPIKDFTKVPNSTIKKAIPDGKFRGQSKHTYDVLYSKTRGAVIPKRAIQLTKSELVRATGLEIKTIQRHLSFLEDEGFIKRDPRHGDHKGAIYEVFIYEETLPESTLVQSGVVEHSTGESSAKSVPESGVKSTILGQCLDQVNKGENEHPNTLFNTNTKNDDEAFAPLISVFLEIKRELHKDELSRKDKEDIKLLAAQMLTTWREGNKLKPINSIFAWMTAHIKRGEVKEEKGSKFTDTVGRATKEIEEYSQPKSADEIDVENFDEKL